MDEGFNLKVYRLKDLKLIKGSKYYLNISITSIFIQRHTSLIYLYSH